MPGRTAEGALGETYAAAKRKVWIRLVPVLMLAYGLNSLDRTNISLAKTHLQADLGISAAAFGLGAGIFFIGYCLLEIPSNLMLRRFGARRWISRIIVSWGAVSTLMMFVHDETAFYVMRFLLGVAEAGLYPGLMFYFTLWFAPRDRSLAVGVLLSSAMFAGIVGNPLGGAILTLDGAMGLHGWQWLFLIEGLPTVILGLALWSFLPDGPRTARWLSPREQEAVVNAAQSTAPERYSLAGALRSVFSSPVLLSIGLLYLFSNLCSYGVIFFMPSIVAAFGIHGSIAIGAFSGLPMIGALLGVLIYPRLRRGNDGVMWIIAASIAGTAVTTYLAAQYGAVVSLVCLGIMQFLVLGICPLLFSMAMNRVHGRESAAGLAMVNSIGLLGGFIGPTVLGAAESRTGDPSAGLVLLSILSLVALVVAGGLAYLLHRQPTPVASGGLVGVAADRADDVAPVLEQS